MPRTRDCQSPLSDRYRNHAPGGIGGSPSPKAVTQGSRPVGNHRHTFCVAMLHRGKGNPREFPLDSPDRNLEIFAVTLRSAVDTDR